MATSTPARADTRALLGAAALGAILGLALGGGYLAGGLARASSATPAAVVALRPAADPARQPETARLRGLPGDNPAALRLVPAAAPFSLRGALRAPRELECLSQAVYYEARGEGDGGMAAVAQVVLNRVRHPRFPKSVCNVVFQHAGASCQFSFACDGQVRRRVEGGAWRRAERIAARALTGVVMADVGAATDFRGGGGGPPAGLMRVAQIGGHVFYRFSGHPGPPAASSGGPQAPAAGRPVLASFAPASADQVILAGARAVERAAAAITLRTPPASVELKAAPNAAPGPAPRAEAQASIVRADAPVRAEPASTPAT